MAVNLTADQATHEFLACVNAQRRRRAAAPVSWSTALKFLNARKFDVHRAITLFEQHEMTRHREGLVLFDPTAEPLKSELDTGKFSILPTRDETGAAIAVFTAHIHRPHITSHQTTLQGVVYQLDVALENVHTQRCGLVFIYDMSDSKYSNFDYDLSQKILTLLKGAYPARLKKVLIVTAPLWFKAPFKILRLFVREKLRERVHTVSAAQLTAHVPACALPRRLGGTLEPDHAAWLVQCLAAAMTTRAAEQRIAAESLNGVVVFQDQESAVLSETERDVSGDSHSYPITTFVSNDDDEEDSEVTSTGNTHEIWQCSTGNRGATSPSSAPASSASSGFSDDESLHCDDAGGSPLEQYVSSLESRGRAGLVQDYSEIRARPPDGTFNNARLKSNLPKNRYTDVLCYDHTRVLLSVQDNEPTSDYINANFVDGYKQKNAFISTQGPLPKTMCDFWRMVWEQQCLVIVMTTRVVERGRTKCGQYWEVGEGEVAIHGDFCVATGEVEHFADYTVTAITLTHTQTGVSREVSHWQFTSWPDYGVPKSALAMLDFLDRVRLKQAQMLVNLGDTWAGHARGPPIVVHCSAGIGRTGTFCTLDICINRLEDVATVDVRGTVERIRSQRAYSIQMPDQYVFCHLALVEYAVSKHLVSGVDLTALANSQQDDSD